MEPQNHELRVLLHASSVDNGVEDKFLCISVDMTHTITVDKTSRLSPIWTLGFL